MTDPEHERDDRREVRVRRSEDEPVDRELGDLDEALETHEFPTTAEELIEDFGEWEVQSRRGWTSIEDVFAPLGEETYDSPDEVRTRIQELVHRE